MSTTTATVQDFMTIQPLTIGAEESLHRAASLMRLHAIRHLPVVSKGVLVGILSERDVHVAMTLRDKGLDELTVSMLMNDEPLVVEADTPLTDVAAHMVDRRAGSAVVAHAGSIVGIFTTVDALLALHRLTGVARVT